MQITYRNANAHDLPRCSEIRGLASDNPIAQETLIEMGVTRELWQLKIENKHYIGHIAA